MKRLHPAPSKRQLERPPLTSLLLLYWLLLVLLHCCDGPTQLAQIPAEQLIGGLVRVAVVRHQRLCEHTDVHRREHGLEHRRLRCQQLLWRLLRLLRSLRGPSHHQQLGRFLPVARDGLERAHQLERHLQAVPAVGTHPHKLGHGHVRNTVLVLRLGHGLVLVDGHLRLRRERGCRGRGRRRRRRINPFQQGRHSRAPQKCGRQHPFSVCAVPIELKGNGEKSTKRRTKEGATDGMPTALSLSLAPTLLLRTFVLSFLFFRIAFFSASFASKVSPMRPYFPHSAVTRTTTTSSTSNQTNHEDDQREPHL